MSLLKNFDEQLQNDRLFWLQLNEIGDPDGIATAEDFAASDWKKVDSFWRERSDAWKSCFVEVISEVLPKDTFIWLTELLSSESEKLAVHALENLMDLRRAGNQFTVPDSLRPRVFALYKKNRSFSKTQLQQLVDELFPTP